MTRLEAEVLSWLAEEQRPASHLLALEFDALIGWVREHGGKLAHQDAAVRMRNALEERLRARLPDASAPGAVPRVGRFRRYRHG